MALILLVSAPMWAQIAVPSIVWSKYGGAGGGTSSWPSSRGYLNPAFDAPTDQMFIFAGPANSALSNTIYSSDEWYYSTVSHSWTKHFGGNLINHPGRAPITAISATNPAVVTVDNVTNVFMSNTLDAMRTGYTVAIVGVTGTGCSGLNGSFVVSATNPGAGTFTIPVNASGCTYSGSAGNAFNYACTGYAGQPPNGHPGTTTLDPVRRKAYLFGDLNDLVCGALGTPTGIWSIGLDDTPPVSWTQIDASAHILQSGVGGGTYNGAATYDPDDDVHFLYGASFGYLNNTQVFCETNANPTITAKQVAAGCTSTGTTISVTDSTGTGGTLCTSDATKCPYGVYFTFILYDTTRHKVLLFGGSADSGATWWNDVWAYDVPTHAWTKRFAGQCTVGVIPCSNTVDAPPVAAQGIGIWVFDPTTTLSIWHSPSGATSPTTWAYDYDANVWTQMSASGTIPQTGSITGSDCNSSSASIACPVVGTFDTVNRKIIGWGKDSSTATTIWEGQLSSGGSAAAISTAGKVNFTGTVH